MKRARFAVMPPQVAQAAMRLHRHMWGRHAYIAEWAYGEDADTVNDFLPLKLGQRGIPHTQFVILSELCDWPDLCTFIHQILDALQRDEAET